MEHYAVILLIMVLMAGTSGIAQKINLPVPVLLLVVGMLIGFAPSIPSVELDPDIVMLLFLPPLLYDAAFNTSFKDLQTNINTITTLATGLVFLTTAGIAVVTHYLVPGMSWPLAFVLGSVLSPTDAVAAIGITKGLNLPHKTITILEGESLVNDASALIAYRFAVAAVTGIVFVWWKASLQFLLVIGGGLLVGVVISKTLALALRYFRDNDMVVISLTMLTPFITYLIAEHFDVSGVIAVVMLGLGVSRLSRATFPDSVKNQSRHFWDIIVFLLNGLIFLLIGMQFPLVLKKIDYVQSWTYLGYAAIIMLVALSIRFLRVYLHQFHLKRAFRSIQRSKTRRKVSNEALIDSKTSFIISWSGMRGIVSLAVALGLPVFLDSGKAFPMRDEIIFMSIGVVFLSLLFQGLTLPWVVRKLNKNSAEKL